MNIGVDVDGVLNNIEEFHNGAAARFFEKKYQMKVVDPGGFDVRDVFQCSEKQRTAFWIRNIWKYCLAEPVRPGAAETIMNLHNENHKIYIITSRIFANKPNLLGAIFRFMLKHWLKKNHIYYDDIYFCSDTNSAGDKAFGCEKYDIDVMIEDKPDNIMELSKRCKLLCFDAAYNRDCKGEKIDRVYHWNDVYQQINKTNEKREVIGNE